MRFCGSSAATANQPAGRWAVLAALLPLLLGTAATVTASGGLLTG